MKTFQLMTLTLVGALVASAAPAEVQERDQNEDFFRALLGFPSSKQQTQQESKAISVQTWSGSNCEGQVATAVKVGGNGDVMCVPNRGGNSIKFLTPNSGCTVTTWSGTDCRGSSEPFGNPGTRCENIPFGSITISC